MSPSILTSPLLIALAVISFALYTGMLLYYGYSGYKNSSTLRDFVLGSGTISGVAIGFSFAASWASANSFVGVPGIAYGSGISSLWWVVGEMLVAYLGIIFFSKRFWLMSRIGRDIDSTLPEWLGRKFDSAFLRVASGVLVLFMIAYIVGQMVGAATLFGTVFGIPYVPGVIAALGLVVFYVSLGGMDATILTDYVQGVLMVIVALLSFGSMIWVFGTPFFMGEISSQLASQSSGLVSVFDSNSLPFGGPLAVIALSLLFLTQVLMPHLQNRILALESRRELRRFVYTVGASMFMMFWTMIWVGLAGRALFPDLANPDAVVPAYLVYAFPNWVAVLMVIGILSAILTTADSVMHVIVTIISNDIYKHGFVEHFTDRDHNTASVDRRGVWVARLSLLGVAILTLIGAIQRPDSLTLLTQIGIAGFLSGIFVPTVAAYLWSGVTKRGAEAGFVVGAGTYIASFIAKIGPYSNDQFMSLMVAVIFSAIVLVVVSLLGSDTTVKSKQDQAFGRYHAEGGQSDD